MTQIMWEFSIIYRFKYLKLTTDNCDKNYQYLCFYGCVGNHVHWENYDRSVYSLSILNNLLFEILFSPWFLHRTPKVKWIRNPSLFLQQCAFTMHRPSVHSITQWWSHHTKEDGCTSWSIHSIASSKCTYMQWKNFKNISAFDFSYFYAYCEKKLPNNRNSIIEILFKPGYGLKVASWSLTQEVAGSSPFTVMTNISVTGRERLIRSH